MVAEVVSRSYLYCSVLRLTMTVMLCLCENAGQINEERGAAVFPNPVLLKVTVTANKYCYFVEVLRSTRYQVTGLGTSTRQIKRFAFSKKPRTKTLAANRATICSKLR